MTNPIRPGDVLTILAFDDVPEYQVLIKGWRRHADTVKPQSSLGYHPPASERFVPKDQRSTMH